MIEVSLVFSGLDSCTMDRNHLFSDSEISAFKNLEREELMFGENGIVTISNFSSLADKQKH